MTDFFRIIIAAVALIVALGLLMPLAHRIDRGFKKDKKFIKHLSFWPAPIFPFDDVISDQFTLEKFSEMIEFFNFCKRNDLILPNEEEEDYDKKAKPVTRKTLALRCCSTYLIDPGGVDIVVKAFSRLKDDDNRIHGLFFFVPIVPGDDLGAFGVFEEALNKVVLRLYDLCGWPEYEAEVAAEKVTLAAMIARGNFLLRAENPFASQMFLDTQGVSYLIHPMNKGVAVSIGRRPP